MNNLTADEATGSVFALLYLLHYCPRVMIAVCRVVSCLCLYHMQIQVILTKVWSQSASQPKSHLSGPKLALQLLIFLETPGNIALNLYCKTEPKQTLEQIDGSIPWCID